MPIPPHVAQLRAYVGHQLLWLATARNVTVDGQGHVLLGRYADSSAWSLPGGVIDPGEQPADAAVRECYEETGIIGVPEALTSVTVSGLITHDGGDLTRHLDITFRCRADAGTACANDGEFEEVRWHPIDDLPELGAYDLDLLTTAIAGDDQAAYTFSGLPGPQDCSSPTRILLGGLQRMRLRGQWARWV